MSSRELKAEVEQLNQHIQEEYLEKSEQNHNYLMNYADESVKPYLNQ